MLLGTSKSNSMAGSCIKNMNKHKLYITEERIKGLEYFSDSLLFQLRGNSSSIIKVRALASAVCQVIF